MWKRKRKAEWLPWYRARNYKGDLTEAEKRQFDAFRMQPKHPAAQEDDLPEEVQSYIGRIEMELYDKKQEGARGPSSARNARSSVDLAPVVVVGNSSRGFGQTNGENECQKKQPSTTERQLNIVRTPLTIITKQQSITRLDITKRLPTTPTLRGDTGFT